MYNNRYKMKRFIISLALLCCMTIAVAQNALFNKYANTKGVTTVTIGSAMLQFMGNGRVGDKDISKIAGKLKSIRILDCERPSITSIIYKEAQQYYHKYRYVVAMDTNEDGEHTTIYMKEYGKVEKSSPPFQSAYITNKLFDSKIVFEDNETNN